MPEEIEQQEQEQVAVIKPEPPKRKKKKKKPVNIPMLITGNILLLLFTVFWLDYLGMVSIKGWILPALSGVPGADRLISPPAEDPYLLEEMERKKRLDSLRNYEEKLDKRKEELAVLETELKNKIQKVEEERMSIASEASISKVVESMSIGLSAAVPMLIAVLPSIETVAPSMSTSPAEERIRSPLVAVETVRLPDVAVTLLAPVPSIEKVEEATMS